MQRLTLRTFRQMDNSTRESFNMGTFWHVDFSAQEHFGTRIFWHLGFSVTFRHVHILTWGLRYSQYALSYWMNFCIGLIKFLFQGFPQSLMQNSVSEVGITIQIKQW
jgi:hypothetical protein